MSHFISALATIVWAITFSWLYARLIEQGMNTRYRLIGFIICILVGLGILISGILLYVNVDWGDTLDASPQITALIPGFIGGLVFGSLRAAMRTGRPAPWRYIHKGNWSDVVKWMAYAQFYAGLFVILTWLGVKSQFSI